MTTNTDDGILPHNAALPFSGYAALNDCFEQGLVRMARRDTLPLFILVLANACFEESLFARLREPLDQAFARWRQRFDAGSQLVLDAPADDVAVFQAVRAHGLEKLEATQWRRLGPWELQFNGMRAFRPPRASGGADIGLRRAFDATRFHFDKPHLREEELWSGDMLGTPVRLLYNKFPFAPLHALWVPEVASHRPQFLDLAAHQHAWAVCEHLADALPGVGLAYNALGANASINHLHLQFFVRDTEPLPVEHAVWRHNGGGRDYPLRVVSFRDVAACWTAVEALHVAAQPYNLIYRPGRAFLMPRRPQGGTTIDSRLAAAAWAEAAGSFTTFERTDFDALGEVDLERVLRYLAIAD